MTGRKRLAAFVSAALICGCQQATNERAEPPAPNETVPTSAQVSSPAHAETPTTQPAAGNYGAERFRLVNQRDEIVAVLDNGLTVIAKRVASPVAAVRAYAMTGGVYEGKWLGGGLSHLLEHLVAGGTNGRRTEAQNRDLLQALGN